MLTNIWRLTLVLIWAGIGSWLILFFAGALLLCNLSIFLNYNGGKFLLINWWLPALMSAIAAWLLANYAEKMNKEASVYTLWGRFFLNQGKRHHIFWIPLRYWSFIFLGIALWRYFSTHG